MAKLPINKKSSFWAYIWAIITVSGWGLSFVATKVIMEGGAPANPSLTLSPTEAYLYRFVVAYFIIAIISHRKWWCNSLQDEMLALLCGITAGSLYFIAENQALILTYTANVALLTGTSPLVTILIVGILYKSERPGAGIIVGSFIAFLGVVAVIINSSSTEDIGMNPLGDLLAFSVAFLWAIYSIIVKRLNVVYDAMFLTRKTFFYGIITALPFLIFEPELRNPFTVIIQGWPSIDCSLIFLIFGPTIISFYLWAVTVKNFGAVKANNFLYLQAIVSVIASALLLGERVGIVGYTGFALILFGLWFGDYLQNKFIGKTR